MKNSLIISVLVLIIAAAVFAIGWEIHNVWNANGGTGIGGVACTMEALACPDGSYVGRQGPACSFAACPDHASFEGTLEQTSSGFRLIMAAPEGTSAQEVAYVMPLELKVTNVLSQFVGQKVQVFGSFTEGNTLAVDTMELLPGAEADKTLGDVAVGKSTFINGVRITLNSVVQDNRCPVDVQCIEAGAITANVTLQSNTDKETRNMASDEAPLSFDSYKISIEKIAPPRLSGEETAPKSYVLVFKVSAN